MGNPPKVRKELAQKEKDRVFSLLRTEPRDGFLPGQVKRHIRTIIWEDFNYIKSESQMQTALDRLQQLEKDILPRMRLGSNTLRFNYDWVDALDVYDMLSALSLQIEFSLFRKESRGAFYRQDYPNTDNKNWLKHILGHIEDGELKLETQPVDLPYVEPEEEIASFFDVDY
mgnify:CR=1 FL=1